MHYAMFEAVFLWFFADQGSGELPLLWVITLPCESVPGCLHKVHKFKFKVPASFQVKNINIVKFPQHLVLFIWSTSHLFYLMLIQITIFINSNVKWNLQKQLQEGGSHWCRQPYSHLSYLRLVLLWWNTMYKKMTWGGKGLFGLESIKESQVKNPTRQEPWGRSWFRAQRTPAHCSSWLVQPKATNLGWYHP